MCSHLVLWFRNPVVALIGGRESCTKWFHSRRRDEIDPWHSLISTRFPPLFHVWGSLFLAISKSISSHQPQLGKFSSSKESSPDLGPTQFLQEIPISASLTSYITTLAHYPWWEEHLHRVPGVRWGNSFEDHLLPTVWKLPSLAKMLYTSHADEQTEREFTQEVARQMVSFLYWSFSSKAFSFFS